MVNFNTFGMKGKEFYYRASRISESLNMHGVPIVYTPSSKYDTDINNDPNPEYLDPVDTFVRFVDLPRTTLEKRNWISEGEDPIVVEISSIIFSKYLEWRSKGSNLEETDDFIVPVSRWSLVELPYKMFADGSNLYRVTNVQGLTTRPFVWECKLAPQRMKTDMIPETIETEDKLPGNESYDSTTIKEVEDESFEDFSK